jgi:hypothetical protein
VLDFGVPELENAIKQQWNKTWNVVAGTFTKYPFKRRTTKEVTPEEIDAFKEGGGAFWAAFRDLMPFCMVSGGSWVQRGPLARPLALPAGMLSRVNMIARLSRVYFTKDGNRAPLQLTVTPLPLPKEVFRNQPDRTPDRSIDTGASPWAIYHLLEKASQVGDTMVWTLPADGIKRSTVPIRFVVRGDAIALHPWTQFGKD